MRYRLQVDAVMEGTSYGDALQNIARHFAALAADMPTDDPDTWLTDASLAAPQFLADSSVNLTPKPADDARDTGPEQQPE